MSFGIIGTTLVKILSGPIVESVTSIIKKHIDRDISAAEIQGDVERALIKAIAEMTPDQTEIIKAELQSEDYLTRNWRPILGLSAGLIIFWYGWLGPMTVNWFGMPPLKPSDTVLTWIFQITLASLGVLGLDRLAGGIASAVFRRR